MYREFERAAGAPGTIFAHSFAYNTEWDRVSPIAWTLVCFSVSAGIACWRRSLDRDKPGHRNFEESTVMLHYQGIVMLALCATAPASAATWADALFQEHDKDFAVVPRGPTLVHHFRLTNNMSQPIRISDVRVSCGCVSARALENTVAPGQSTAILAEMDTRRFSGAKKVFIFVQFDQPQWEEVRLSVQANSRQDLLVGPESFSFGRITRGSTPLSSVTVSFMGNNSWKINNVDGATGYVQASMKELQRGADEVKYRVTATIRGDAPAGNWFSEVWVRTDNPSAPRIRIPVTVEVEPAPAATSKTASYGALPAGEGQSHKADKRP